MNKLAIVPLLVILSSPLRAADSYEKVTRKELIERIRALEKENAALRKKIPAKAVQIIAIKKPKETEVIPPTLTDYQLLRLLRKKQKLTTQAQREAFDAAQVQPLKGHRMRVQATVVAVWTRNKKHKKRYQLDAHYRKVYGRGRNQITLAKQVKIATNDAKILNIDTGEKLRFWAIVTAIRIGDGGGVNRQIHVVFESDKLP